MFLIFLHRGITETTLFQILAGRLPNQGTLQQESSIYFGGVKVDPRDRDHRKLFAYVAQEDSLHESSTPREALTFSAKLRLPKSTTEEEIKALVQAKLTALVLDSAADTIIGGGFKKGISGGEKRRVSIGLELVASPSVILLDEPTSGLDSYAAAQVMKLLSDVAKAGNTVLFTIHQPGSKIFFSFDRLIILKAGQVMHQGAVSSVRDDFDAAGYPCPANYNPADWIIDVSESTDIEILGKTFFHAEPETNKVTSNEGALLDFPDQGHVSMWREFCLLEEREFRDIKRNPGLAIINISLTAVLALIFGVMFWGIGNTNRSDFIVVQSVLGAVVNVLIATLMGQSNTAVAVFSRDRPLFLREYSTDHYSIIPYFLSKLGSEAFNSFLAMVAQALVVYWMMGFQMGFGNFLAITYSLALTATAVAVMLGACFTDPKFATALFTVVVIPQMYFSGVFIAIDLLPDWVAWAQYLCSLTYASRLSFAYEFSSCEPGVAQVNCQEVLDSNNVDVDDTWWVSNTTTTSSICLTVTVNRGTHLTRLHSFLCYFARDSTGLHWLLCLLCIAVQGLSYYTPKPIIKLDDYANISTRSHMWISF